MAHICHLTLYIWVNTAWSRQWLAAYCHQTATWTNASDTWTNVATTWTNGVLWHRPHQNNTISITEMSLKITHFKLQLLYISNYQLLVRVGTGHKSMTYFNCPAASSLWWYRNNAYKGITGFPTPYFSWCREPGHQQLWYWPRFHGIFWWLQVMRPLTPLIVTRTSTPISINLNSFTVSLHSTNSRHIACR